MQDSHTPAPADETPGDAGRLRLIPTVAAGLPVPLAERVDGHLATFAQHITQGLLAASTAVGLEVMAELMAAEAQFRRVRGYRQLGRLVAHALEQATAGEPGPLGLAASAQFTGYFSLTADDPRVDPTAFLLDHGRYTRIAVPGAVTITAVGINNRTQVVGQYQDADGIFHGYVWERGRFQTIDAPGAVGTSLFDINDRGQIVGVRLEPDGTFRGFVLERGRYITFAAAGAGVTVPGDINNRGQIVGFTASGPAAATAQGFLLARGVNGPFTPVSVPGAPSTLAFGLNDRGQITGPYNNPDAAPSPQQDSSMLPGPLERSAV